MRVLREGPKLHCEIDDPQKEYEVQFDNVDAPIRQVLIEATFDPNANGDRLEVHFYARNATFPETLLEDCANGTPIHVSGTLPLGKIKYSGEAYLLEVDRRSDDNLMRIVLWGRLR